MDPTNPINQSSPTNNISVDQKKLSSSKSIAKILGFILLLFYSFILNIFMILAVGDLTDEIDPFEWFGALNQVGNYIVLYSLMFIILSITSIKFLKKIYLGSKKALKIYIILLICLTVAGFLSFYISHTERAKWYEKDKIRTYNYHVKEDVEYYQRAAINYCYYTGHLPKTLEEISSLPQLSYFRLIETGSRNTGFPEGNYYYDPKIVYNPKIDGTGFSLNGTFNDGREYKKSFDIPAGGCTTTTPFPYLR